MNKKYSIAYTYMTGNSFGSHEETDILELSWDNLEIAKQNLQRILEHYRWYNYLEKSKRYVYSEREVSQPEWWNCEGEGVDNHYKHHKINLFTDKGREMQIWCPWCGYFESLLEAEIVSNKEEDSMKIVI